MSSTFNHAQVLGDAQSAKSTLEVINGTGQIVQPESKTIELEIQSKTITVEVQDNKTSLETIAEKSGTIVVSDEPAATIESNGEEQGSVEASLGYTRNYKNLSYKPSINGVMLVGDLTSAEIGVIDDEQIGEQKTYSSKKIDSLITKVYKGTEDEPLVLSSIEEGYYVISGYVRATETSEPIKAPLKTYVLSMEENNYVLWDGNPYAASQYYIVLPLEDGVAPVEKRLEIVTKDYLHNATLDGGLFVKEEQ